MDIVEETRDRLEEVKYINYITINTLYIQLLLNLV